MVHLEIKKMYEDFNFVMPEKRWFHFEFKSDDVTLDDPKRFREYEAVTSRRFCVADVTKEETVRMQAVLYALASKVLDNDELKDVKEEVVIARLYERLLEKNICYGILKRAKFIVLIIG